MAASRSPQKARRSSRTRPSTTPLRLVRARRSANSIGGKGVGSTEGMGICHAYTPDGRCCRLLKILLTNFCIYDCAYCINRVSSNVPRARFSVDEVVDLTLELLQAQLYRGPVPLVGHHPLGRLHDGAAGAGGEDAARGPRLPRLHPPEADPRGRSRSWSRRRGSTPTGCRSTSSCRATRPERLAPQKDVGVIKKAMGAGAAERRGGAAGARRTAPSRRSSRRPASRPR